MLQLMYCLHAHVYVMIGMHKTMCRILEINFLEVWSVSKLCVSWKINPFQRLPTVQYTYMYIHDCLWPRFICLLTASPGDRPAAKVLDFIPSHDIWPYLTLTTARISGVSGTQDAEGIVVSLANLLISTKLQGGHNHNNHPAPREAPHKLDLWTCSCIRIHTCTRGGIQQHLIHETQLLLLLMYTAWILHFHPIFRILQPLHHFLYCNYMYLLSLNR